MYVLFEPKRVADAHGITALSNLWAVQTHALIRPHPNTAAEFEQDIEGGQRHTNYNINRPFICRDSSSGFRYRAQRTLVMAFLRDPHKYSVLHAVQAAALSTAYSPEHRAAMAALMTTLCEQLVAKRSYNRKPLELAQWIKICK